MDLSVLGGLEGLVRSWRIHLEAENLSPRTIKSYIEAAGQLADFLRSAGMPLQADAIRREHIEAFLVEVRSRTSASSAATRYRGLQQLFRWLAEEGEIPETPMARMKPPKVEEKPVPVIPRSDLEVLFNVCSGRSFEDRGMRRSFECS